MNIWFFVILILAIALILGPISMLRPKPAQRHKETLRMHAAGKGIRFGMRTLPKLKTATEEPIPSPVYYLPPDAKKQSAPTWTMIRTDYQHEGNFYQEWDWYGPYRPPEMVCDMLRKRLPDLPASVSAITQGEAGTCIFWSEKGGTEVLDELIKILHELRQATMEEAREPL